VETHRKRLKSADRFQARTQIRFSPAARQR